MKNIFRHTAIQQIAFWVLSFFVLHSLFTKEYSNDILDVIFTVLFHIPLVAVVYLNYYLVKRYLIQQRLGVQYFLFVIVLLGLGIALHYFTFNYLSDWLFPDLFFVSYYSVWEIIQYVGCYVIISSLLLLSQNWFTLKENQLALEKENSQVKLSSLKAQLNPHFLFNSLNNIYASTSAKDVKARSYLLKLSDALRYMIYDTSEELVPLEKEIDYLENYVALEKLRIENSENINFNITGDFDGLRIAPLILLTLVENCFKHCDRMQPIISITLHAGGAHGSPNENQVHLTTKNNKETEMEDRVGGMGLNNLRNRLNLIYPNRHTFKINESEAFYESEIKINL